MIWLHMADIMQICIRASLQGDSFVIKKIFPRILQSWVFCAIMVLVVKFENSGGILWELKILFSRLI